MAETALTPVTALGHYSQVGVAVTMTAVDNTNGNKFVAGVNQIVLVQNTSGGALTFQMTSQPVPPTNRLGSVSQSLAAGEIRAFRVTESGWEDTNGNVLIPTGLNTSLKVGIINL
mgnify:CR=1 FL=1